MSEALNTFLLVYAALFPIVNPVGGAPIFLGLTRRLGDAERHALALRVAIGGFLLLLGSLLVGSYVLSFFGITLPIVRIAGGVVVSAFAWKLLHEGEQPEDRRGAADMPRAPRGAFYPLTMPLTVGPGSMSVAVTLGSQRPPAPDFLDLALLGAAAVAGLLAVAATIFLCYRFAERIRSGLGERGTGVLVRLSAFILLCIGIQIVWNGWRALNAGG